MSHLFNSDVTKSGVTKFRCN